MATDELDLEVEVEVEVEEVAVTHRFVPMEKQCMHRFGHNGDISQVSWGTFVIP
jgi:hypothetical protein